MRGANPAYSIIRSASSYCTFCPANRKENTSLPVGMAFPSAGTFPKKVVLVPALFCYNEIA
ncbi:hypothetical protein HMPREF9413_5016 [Paenibacillus sp. HGF7]|nr:hypothetical protein HMPREF9413_5016 [Paenibacillus sp. HGF7]